MIIFSKK